MMKLMMVPLALLSLVRMDIEYLRDQPQWSLWGDRRHIHWDEEDHVWVNTNLRYEGWINADWEASIHHPKLRDDLLHGERVPVKKRIIVVFRNDFWRRQDDLPAVAAAFFAEQRSRRRLLLINVEQFSEQHERAWPHLGMLTVGTVAHEEGWDVGFWDELIQGPVPLETVVEPGDVIGLSLVVTGMDRGVELARQAKALGARHVIAGNDAAIFRAKQLLRIPDRPIDAVFTSNSTTAVRLFFREIQSKDLREIEIQDVATDADQAETRSNERSVLRLDLAREKNLRRAHAFDPMDGFTIPNLALYSPEYWERIWTFYRSAYGHKHADPANLRNATIHLAQGCTRTRGTDVCTYCTIYGVGDIRVPDEEYLARLAERYQAFGINYLYNVTDSAFEMRPLASRLRAIGFRTNGLIIYGRAQGLAAQRALLDDWMGLVSERLLINCGMDSGDDGMLHQGILKSSSSRGSRVAENRQAVRNLRDSGAHLHASLIFGSPGETVESCERTLEFTQWFADTLGPQLDLVESDLYWLNFGSLAGRVFRDYDYARELAARAGKDISPEDWRRDFGQHAEALSVPWSAQQAWYRRFTRIDDETAAEYRRRVVELMNRHPGRIKGREYAFKSPHET